MQCVALQGTQVVHLGDARVRWLMKDIFVMIVDKEQATKTGAQLKRSPGSLLPVEIDQDRMDKALAGPRFTVPAGLSPMEIVAYMLKVTKIGA